MADQIMYTLDDGDILLVPSTAKCLRYTPIQEDDGEVVSTNGGPPRQEKRARTQRHPRTPQKWWARRKLVAEHGIVDAAALEGVTPASIRQMAARYHWRFPRYKRGELNGVSDG